MTLTSKRARSASISKLQRYGKKALEETKQQTKRTIKLPFTVRDVLTNHLKPREEACKLAASAWRSPINVMDGRQVEFLFTTAVGRLQC